MNSIISILQKVINSPYSAFFYTPTIYKDAKSYFLEKPIEKYKSNNTNEIFKILDNYNRNKEKYLGFTTLSYELGYLLEEKLDHYYSDSKLPIFNLALFKKEDSLIYDSNKFNYEEIEKLIEYNKFSVENIKYNVDKDEYSDAIAKVKKAIYNGDTYQVNYTIKAKFNLLEENIIPLFANIIFTQSAQYISIINLESHFVISFSPELFFAKQNNLITAKPMKGTVRRGNTLKEDNINKEFLRNNEKDKAENVMIVDLLRNDLGRIAKFNSVKVDSLFDIETYESLFQMTSTIKAELKNDSLTDIIKEIYPCGSITGAPKISTIEIIKRIEKEQRGLYTGTIGLLLPEKQIFNIAIRTVVVDKETNIAEMGIGSGVVWDSEQSNEYEEVILKGSFLTKKIEYFSLFETMLVENAEVFLLDYHIARLKKSSEYFLFNFDESEIRKIIVNEIKKTDSNNSYRLKIILNKWGTIKTELNNFVESKDLFKIKISKTQVNSKNKFLYHKTTMRELYIYELEKAKNEKIDEVIFLNEQGFVTEGTFTNIFIKRDNEIYTPSLENGLLAGCYREFLINSNQVKEKNLTLDDLKNADEIFLTNSLRKIIKVNTIVN